MKYQYLQSERDAKGRLIAKGLLKHGLKIGDAVCKHFTLQEAITADLLAAEDTASIQQALGFSAALLARQLVSIDEFDGPFTPGMLGQLRVGDFNILRAAQLEIDKAGEIEQ